MAAEKGNSSPMFSTQFFQKYHQDLLRGITLQTGKPRAQVIREEDQKRFQQFSEGSLAMKGARESLRLLREEQKRLSYLNNELEALKQLKKF